MEVTENNELKVNLAEVEYPEGISFQDTTRELEDVFGVHLGKLDFAHEVDYEFDTTEAREFYVRLLSEKARQNPQATLDNLYLYGSLPIFVRRLIPDTRLKLGLDLKGGVHLVLEVDLEASKAALFKEHALSIPDQMRTEDILCREVKQVEGQDALNVFVGIPSRLRSDAVQKTEYLQKAQRILNETEFFEDARQLSNETETQSVYQLRLTQSGIQQYSEQAIEQVLIVLRNRVDAFGVSEPSIRREANQPRIIVELPGAEDSSKPLQIVREDGADSNSNSSRNRRRVETSGAVPRIRLPLTVSRKIAKSANTGKPEAGTSWKVRYLLTGDRITDAFPTTGRTSFDIVVSLSFDGPGRRKFAQITGDHIGEHLAILLDGRVQSAPVIQDQIVGNAIIQGNFTYEEASYLSNILKAGAFPVGVQIAEERTVGPTPRSRIY